MSKAKLVSIITPCYNAEAYLEEYLLSVANQTYRPLELIMVNDGSTDNSEQIFRDMKPLLNRAGVSTVYQKIRHSGQAEAANTGLKLFKGEYLAWADADDILKPQNIEKKVDFLEDHPEIGMVRNDACRLENGKLSQRESKDTDRKTQYLFEKLFLETTYVFAGCYMVRRSLFEVCYPDFNIPYSREGQNLQLLLPPASRTECGFVDEVLMIYRIHPDSHSNHSRSLREYLERTDGFERLYMDLKPYCRYDAESYDRLLDKCIISMRKELIAGLTNHYKRSKMTQGDKK